MPQRSAPFARTCASVTLAACAVPVTMSSKLQAAARAANQVQEAQSEAERIVADAKAEAAKIVADAAAKAEADKTSDVQAAAQRQAEGSGDGSDGGDASEVAQKEQQVDAKAGPESAPTGKASTARTGRTAAK